MKTTRVGFRLLEKRYKYFRSEFVEKKNTRKDRPNTPVRFSTVPSETGRLHVRFCDLRISTILCGTWSTPPG